MGCVQTSGQAHRLQPMQRPLLWALGFWVRILATRRTVGLLAAVDRHVGSVLHEGEDTLLLPCSENGPWSPVWLGDCVEVRATLVHGRKAGQPAQGRGTGPGAATGTGKVR